ncbi:aminopeptidase [Brachybacterium avium]|uniref:Aminopeptidase n=1 Tax=Brachybacterium avium TaxID=2017485 RepID=A0A220U958_9MICO|nr:M28 family peptidase [Brachybacterium avium]ASK64658.1 aminopeptidase [Brachybacterium avium]
MTTSPEDGAATEHAGTDPAAPEPLAAAPRWHAALLLLVLLAVVASGFAFRGVPEPRDDSAPQDVFSAQRAQQAVASVVDEPRPLGSDADDRAHAELAAQLTALGFETETQEGIGVRARENEASAGYVRNLIAIRAGSDPTGTLVLATHIDSVPGAPGAADAGVGLAVILETVRVLGPEELRNDLVILLVDGEERGLLGSDAYLDGPGRELTAPVVVLNHEARGISGRPLVTRASGPMHAVIGSAPDPEFESFTDALFGIIPNYTDFSSYRDAGWWGMDMAIIDEAWAYHSPQDDAAHLDAGSLQHYGDLTLALSRDLGARDLTALREHADEHPVQTTAPWGVVQMPPALVTGLGLLGPLAILAALLVRRRRAEVSLPGAAAGAVIGLLVLAGGVLGAFALWSATAAATPEMLSGATREPVRATPFLLAEMLIAATAVTAGWVLARLLISRAAALLGGALAVTTLLAVLAVYSPALGSSMIPPAAIAALGTLLAALLPPLPGLLVRAAALLPTAWMLGTQLSALAEFGIASAAGGLAGTALIGLGAAGPLLLAGTAGRHGRPVLLAGERPVRRPHRLLIPVLPAVLALGMVIGGTAWTLASPEPAQELVTAQVDAGSGDTRWEVTGTTAWGRALDGTSASSDVEAPAVAAEVSAAGALEITVDAPRDASALVLRADTGLLTGIAVDGVPVESGQGVDQLSVHGVRAGQRVTITATAAPGAELTLVERSHDPSLAAGWVAPGEEVSLVQPRMEVSVVVPR